MVFLRVSAPPAPGPRGTAIMLNKSLYDRKIQESFTNLEEEDTQTKYITLQRWTDVLDQITDRHQFRCGIAYIPLSQSRKSFYIQDTSNSEISNLSDVTI